MSTLKAIKFRCDDKANPQLEILDQLVIPHQTVYLSVDSIAPLTDNILARFSGYEAIKGMYTRGAPAIMLVGCYSIVVELSRVLNDTDLGSKFGYNLQDLTQFKTHLVDRIDLLISSRPTAVNLSNGCNQVKGLINSFTSSNLFDLYDSILEFATNLYKEDLQFNIDIGENGLKYILETLKQAKFSGPFSVMTICNTGSLATSNYGTALGIVRHLNNYLAKSKSQYDFYFEHVYACETRPYNQGSRLTAFELQYDNIPSTLITDNMVSFLVDNLNRPEHHANQNIKLKSNAPLMFVIVGADRIVLNGDLANKIGTFQLSLIAKLYDNIKFIGAAPTTTIDLDTKSGSSIRIEERPHNELTEVSGALIQDNADNNQITLAKVRTAPVGVNVWNPSFDVTPHQNIDCIVTEKDYFTKDVNGDFHF